MKEEDDVKSTGTMLCLSFVLLLSGCGTLTIDWSANDQAPVKKGSPVVFIHPMADVYHESSVGVLPFQIPDNMTAEQGLGVSSMFKDVLLGKRAFNMVKQLTSPYGNLSDAVRIGKKEGVDLILAGRINYALEGTELGGARADVSMRLLNTQTGNTIWYVEQTMDQPMDYPDSNIASRLLNSFSMPAIRNSAGAPVLPNMLAQIAADMTDVMAGARSVPNR